MDRNVYSIVLLEELVDEVDRLACEHGTSRSGIINRILANYFSYSTPEEKIRDTFNCMEQVFSGAQNFQVRSRQSETMLTIYSALKYRYHPAVRYALELYRQSADSIGELRVTLRTKSPSLKELVTDFFQFRQQMENRWIGRRFPSGHVPCETGPAHFTRTFLAPASEQDRTAERISGAICGYIFEFDRELKQYCAGSDSPGEARKVLEEEYRNHLRKSILV